MKSHFYTQAQLITLAQFFPGDIEQIYQRRRQHNRLGFGYQLAFVRVANRFPRQNPLEVTQEILVFVSVQQLNISAENIDAYAKRRQKIK